MLQHFGCSQLLCILTFPLIYAPSYGDMDVMFSYVTNTFSKVEYKMKASKVLPDEILFEDKTSKEI